MNDIGGIEHDTYNKYKDIIDLPHHVSARHPQMSIHDRAAQFAPFAALTGYEAAIKERARLTEKKRELTDDEKEILDRKLRDAEENAGNDRITVTYFIADGKKEGGAYGTVDGIIKKIDRLAGILIMEGGERVSIENIVKIE